MTTASGPSTERNAPLITGFKVLNNLTMCACALMSAPLRMPCVLEVQRPA